MERLSDVFRYYGITAWVLFMTMFFSVFTQAKGPDFDNMTQHKLDLSGTVINYELPGRLDKRFPLRGGQTRVNIFDVGRYDGLFYDSLLLERNWTYRGFFWQGSGSYYCMSSLRILLTRLPEPSAEGAILQVVEAAETKAVDDTYRELNLEFAKTFNYQLGFSKEDLNGLPVLVATEIDARTNGKVVKTSYHIPIGDSHYLSFQFDAAMVSDASREKWLGEAKRDMRRIMESVVVSD
ncbi:hypothetical protein SIN8267_00126 [Sinobacterium norvegicum]|uniref:Uncharacterized protein n=1 Tax=Sinobacterium norvegicum TaxID=1641715 RepID=A0ABN8ECE1_9GAMM|nr:hypothetical protein [Sinobacterium norvegicum]CAH0990043.1 hypothetical protein SIN8267_00126 [Sinobacterium norvegicum]